jgi:hypothetical protein
MGDSIDTLLDELAQGVYGVVDYAQPDAFEIALTAADEALIFREYWASARLTSEHKHAVLIHGVRAAFAQLFGVVVVWGAETREVRLKPTPPVE